MTAKISVIIPAFNCAEYISDAIASVIDQSFSPHEIIVVDDGSTDSTGQVLADFAHEKIIKYFKQSNQGPSAARNYGVNEATGDLICFLDADDLLLPECLQQVNDFYQSVDEPTVFFQNFYKHDISDPVMPASSTGHWETGPLWQEISKYGDMEATSLVDVYYLNYGWYLFREKRHGETQDVLLDCRTNAGWSAKHWVLHLLTIIPKPIVATLLLVKQKF